MLFIARSMKELNFSQLMAVYAESNGQKEEGMLAAEQDFYQYLRESFFKTPGAYYAVWLSEGKYVSAFRMEPYKDGVLLEGLETVPNQRRKGFAQMLMCAVLPREKKVYSHVSKRNIPSLKVHEKCGFRRISEQAVYIDGSVDGKCCTLCFEKAE